MLEKKAILPAALKDIIPKRIVPKPKVEMINPIIGKRPTRKKKSPDGPEVYSDYEDDGHTLRR